MMQYVFWMLAMWFLILATTLASESGNEASAAWMSLRASSTGLTSKSNLNSLDWVNIGVRGRSYQLATDVLQVPGKQFPRGWAR